MAMLAAGRTIRSLLVKAGMPASSRLQQTALHSTDTQSPAPGEDPFTLSLQSKTEEEMLELLQKARQQQQEQQEEEDDDMVDTVNPETGKPTRT